MMGVYVKIVIKIVKVAILKIHVIIVDKQIIDIYLTVNVYVTKVIMMMVFLINVKNVINFV